MKPFAARYAGHQFGSWAGQLGDGRAISLGEIEARDGSWWEIQLKGAGRTPYSRRGDGRAVLRSSLREFLCSEAMHGLGVPTTRALSLVGTGDVVIRDMFYGGDPRPEPGAIVARVAPTFIRFGNFEMMTAAGEIENLRALADYVIRHHYPELGEPSEAVYVRWFEEICRRTATLMAHWMTVGFVHGVMNTDNMSILGLTIDYGPYGWLEPYDPDWTPNTTDFGFRRYAYGQQADVALWNLAMLAQALSPLVTQPDGLQAALDGYRETYADTYLGMMREKLGLTRLPNVPPLEDQTLVETLHYVLSETQMDLTLFFRHLSDRAVDLLADSPETETVSRDLLEAASYAPLSGGGHEPFRQWLGHYQERLQREPTPAEAIQTAMRDVNPKYVLRNYLAQRAIEGAEAGDLSLLERLMQVLKKPYAEQPEHNDLAAKRPEWARTRPGCATLSCSS
jgi:serine/tyrosine/threonine adenylyltransferase